MDYMGNFKGKEDNKEKDEIKVITLPTIIGIIVTLLISFALLYYGIGSKYKEINGETNDTTKTGYYIEANEFDNYFNI